MLRVAGSDVRLCSQKLSFWVLWPKALWQDSPANCTLAFELLAQGQETQAQTPLSAASRFSTRNGRTP